MNTRPTNHQSERQALRDEWSQIVSNFEASGKSKAGFCRDHGLPIWKLQYWVRALRKPVQSSSSFIELSPVARPSNSGVWISCGGYRVYMDAGFDGNVLRRVIEVLS